MQSFFNDPVLNNAANLHQQTVDDMNRIAAQKTQNDATNAKLDQIQGKIAPAVDTANTNARLIHASVTGQLNPQFGGTPSDGGGNPGGGMTDEPLVKIKNNSTGEERMVPQSQVGYYTGQGGGQNPQPKIGGGQPAVANGSPYAGQSATTNAASASYPGAVNPQSGQESTDQQQAQTIWRNAGNLQQQDNISSQWSASHGYDLFGTKPLSAQQSNLEQNTKQGNLTKQQVQTVLNTYGKAAHGNVFQGFIGNLPGQQGSTYENLRNNLGEWGKDMPTTSDTNEQAQQKIMALDNKMRNTYGFSLDSKYLQQFGLGRDQNGNVIAGGKNANSAQQPSDVVGKLAKGAVGDIGALLHAPIDLAQNIAKNTVKEGYNPQQGLQDTAIDIGKGMVNEYGNLAGVQTKNNQPILAPGKSVFEAGGFNMPTGINGQAALQHAENHPVNTALDLLPVLKGITALKGAKAAEGAEGIAATEVPGKIPNDSQVHSFASNFTVPTKRAVAADLNLAGTSKEILQHIDSGMNAKNLTVIPEQVTGDHGIITSMTRDAVDKLEGNAQVAPVKSAAQDILDRTTGISASDETKVMRDITKPFDNGKSGTISDMTSTDLYNHARSLYAEAADYKRQDSYITPNKSAAGIAKAYSAAGDAIMSQLENMSKNSNVLQTIKTPDRIAALEQISPRLAEQVRQANTIQDLRRTAAPFVKLDQIQKLSQDAENSTFGKVANQMVGRRSGVAATGGKALGSSIGGFAGSALGPMGTMAGERIGGAIGGMGGMLVDKAMMPQYRQAAETVMPKVRSMASFTGNGIKNAGKAVKLYGKTANMARFTQQNP